MDTRRITAAAGATAGGVLASAFIAAGLATAAPDVTVGDGSFTIDGLTYTPDGPATYLETTLSYPPYYQSAIAGQEWDVTDATGYHLGSFGNQDGDLPTTLTDWYGITTTQFTVGGAPADWEAGDIASALRDLGVSDANFLAGDVELVAQFLAHDPDIDFSTLTGTQLADALANFPLQWVDSGDLAELLRPFHMYNADAFAAVLGDAGVTDSNFTGATLQQVGSLFELNNQFDPTDVAHGAITPNQISTLLDAHGIGLAGGLTAAQLATDLNHGTFVDDDTIAALLSSYGFTDASFVGGSLSDVVAKLSDAFQPIDVANGYITDDQVAAALGTIGFNMSITHDSIAELLNGLDFSNLPAEGTTYAITHLMSGLGGDWYNVYEMVPGLGSADPIVTDTLVTPLGDMDMTWMVNLFGWDPLLDAGSMLGGDV